MERVFSTRLNPQERGEISAQLRIATQQRGQDVDREWDALVRAYVALPVRVRDHVTVGLVDNPGGQRYGLVASKDGEVVRVSRYERKRTRRGKVDERRVGLRVMVLRESK